jgi:CTP:molybdopterin cytidylyltransferase MocA
MSHSLAHSDLNIGAIVLAAGSASRMGHRPKCLLELNGEPMIRRLVNAISAAGIKNIVVVLGHYAEHIKPIVTELPATLVHNPAPADGQNASLHYGLRGLPKSSDTIIVALADQPLINAEDINELLSAYRTRPAAMEVMVPMLNNLPGNPVLFSASVRDAILMRDLAFGCKQWQMENSGRVYRWPTANEHYRIDIDTPGDIENFAARTGLQLCWPSAL